MDPFNFLGSAPNSDAVYILDKGRKFIDTRPLNLLRLRQLAVERAKRYAVLQSGRYMNGKTHALGYTDNFLAGKKETDTGNLATLKAALSGLVDKDARKTLLPTMQYGALRAFDNLLMPVLWIRGKKFDLQQQLQDALDDKYKLQLGRNYNAVQTGSLLFGAGASTLATTAGNAARAIKAAKTAVGATGPLRTRLLSAARLARKAFSANPAAAAQALSFKDKLLNMPKAIANKGAKWYSDLVRWKGIGAPAELAARPLMTHTGDTPLEVKLRISKGKGFFPLGIITPLQKQAYIRLIVSWQVRHTDTGNTATSMTLQFAAPFAAGGVGSLIAKGLGFIPGVKKIAPIATAVFPTAGFLGTAYSLPNALAQKTRKALQLFGALAQTDQKTNVKPMSAYYLAYQALKDPVKKALLARQMVQKAYKDRMFSSVLANKLKLISNTGNRGIIPSYLAAKKLLRGLQLTPNLWQGIIDSQDIPYFGNIVKQKLQQGTQLAVNKFGTLLQSYIQAYSKEQDPTKRLQLARLIAQKITANRMPNFIRNQLIEGKVRGNQQVGGINQLDIDKGVFGRLSVLQMKAAPKAGKLVLQQMQQLPDTRDVYLKYTDPTVVLQLKYMGLQGAYNWFNQKIDDPNTDVYEVGLAALLFQRAFNLSDLQALSSPITKKLKQKCVDQIWNNPDNLRKAIYLWLKSKGADGFADFIKNPIAFYGMLAVLVGAPLLMGFSAGLSSLQQPILPPQQRRSSVTDLYATTLRR